MVQEFFINQHSELPVLRLELINDGRNDYRKFHDAIESADISFTMVNTDTGVIKIANEKAYIALKDKDSCEKQYVIYYPWKKRDTREKGVYEGYFNISFDDSLTSEYTTYPKGDLVMPIREKLMIIIR